jgi:hypothetical protein
MKVMIMVALQMRTTQKILKSVLKRTELNSVPKGRLKTKQTSDESSLDSDPAFDITVTILKACHERKTDRFFAPQVDIPIERYFTALKLIRVIKINLARILGLTQCSVFIKKYR